jgi:3-hydroxyacyl-CoA dehydrogenase
MKKTETMARSKPVGLVGLGLMGQGIASCLLAYGFRVIAYNRTASRAEESVSHVRKSLRDMVKRKLVTARGIRGWRERYQLVRGLDELAPCGFIVETIKEELALKRAVYDELEAAVRVSSIISSNTSSIPITILQHGRRRPERFVGAHWGEPVQVMRYLEIIPGKQTAPRAVRLAKQIGEACGKEPTILKKDIRGFLSNRMMYAMMREAFHLVDQGVADLADVDRSFRNDIGWWATIAGPFRWMDLTGIPPYAAIMEDLFPQLCNSAEVPELMKKVLARGSEGISNQAGFYKYDKQSAEEWERSWVDFTYDLRKLVEKYEQRVRL